MLSTLSKTNSIVLASLKLLSANALNLDKSTLCILVKSYDIHLFIKQLRAMTSLYFQKCSNAIPKGFWEMTSVS